MNREQAREIAVKVWVDSGHIGEYAGIRGVADALHAAYEAELDALRQKCERLEDLCKTVSEENTALAWREADKFARLASIKETARAILAADATSSEELLRRHNGFKEGMVSIVDSAIDWAESFESAFERRYGGKP